MPTSSVIAAHAAMSDSRCGSASMPRAPVRWPVSAGGAVPYGYGIDTGSRSMQGLILLLAGALALVHLFAGRLRFVGVIPRSRWLSFAGGLSVAYVFVHLLPEIAEGQERLAETGVDDIVAIESHVWIIALLGLVAFYGLERVAKTSRETSAQAGGEDRTEREVFLLHMGSYGLYNVLIGYLLVHRLEAGLSTLLLFWCAMALHFLVNDYGLREHHREQYRAGRWVLAAAVIAGAVAGLLMDVGEALVAALIAFIGGGVVLNVLKEELPEERKSRFLPFAAGATLYTALLLTL
jgi:uncharacterized membrane protein